MYDTLKKKKLIPDLQAYEMELHTEPTIVKMLKYLVIDRKIHEYIMENLYSCHRFKGTSLHSNSTTILFPNMSKYFA
jgi:hypothetical protein